MRMSGTCKPRLALIAIAVWIGASAVSAAAPALEDLLARIASRVEDYYRRAESIVCLETVTLQALSSSFSPDSFGRVLEYELRVEWPAAADGDEAPIANVVRQLMKINGRTPKPGAEPGCLDPKSISPEPLAFLLPSKRGEYLFSLNEGRRREPGTFVLDYRSRAPGKPEITWQGDCVSFDLPGRTKGRVWIDGATHDVLRVDEQLMGQFDYMLPPERNRMGGSPWWVIERADSSTRYRRVVFHDPDETVILPESIETFQVIRGAGVPRLRITQKFSNYRRFMTGGRLVK